MNFGKLLAVGKSMVNGRAEVAYRVDKQTYLPKFESPKNPFRHQAKPAAAEWPAAKTEAVTPAPAPAAKAPVAAARSSINWKLNPLSSHYEPPARTKPQAGGPAGQPQVQAELSLDSVKVLHNDLSDADVEVVPIKSRPAPPDLQPAKKSWEILGERLLKATALQ